MASQPASSDAPIVMFLCTANSCRSQMAEALAKAKWGDRLATFSAGVKPGVAVDARALAVLRELGVEHAGATPKTIAEAEALFGRARCALVVTVCDNAATDCPYYRNTAKFIHRAFPDPPKLAVEAGEGADPLPFYRAVRDDIAAFVDGLPALIPALSGAPATLRPVPDVDATKRHASSSEMGEGGVDDAAGLQSGRSSRSQ